MNTEARDALQRIVSTWSQLDGWRTRLGVAAPPASGSELAVDDSDFVGWPTSRLAHGGLIAAVDHLQAVRVHLQARNMFPFATGTLLRGALLGSAQAVWLLSPNDRPARLERSRQLAEEMTVNHHRYLNDLRTIAPTPHANTDNVHQHVTQRLVEIRALRAQHGQKGSFKATPVIEIAAESTFGRSVVDEARAEWRRLSGSAHGLAWSTTGLSGNTVTATSNPGIVQMQTGGNLTDYLNPFLLAHHITNKGWELYDRRMVAPSDADA